MTASYPRLTELKTLCESFKGHVIANTVTFMGRTLAINNPNLVGDLLEDVVFPFFKEAFPDFEEGPKQEPPDFMAGDYQFELKAFLGNPGFDISNFTSFVTQLAKDGGLIKKLFKTKYLVFRYAAEGDGFKIADFWMLDVWQLPNYDLTDPLSVQKKKGIWYNLRPGAASSWTDESKTANKFLDNLLLCVDKCEHIQTKDALKASILRQREDATTLGFL